jgi:hypothetical protein
MSTKLETPALTPQPAPRPFKIDPIEPMPHEYIRDTIMENGVEQWAVFERAYSCKWLLVARCPDERCASTIVARLNSSIMELKEQGYRQGSTCVAICSIDRLCEICNGVGYLNHEPGTNVFNDTCPVAKRLHEQLEEMVD